MKSSSHVTIIAHRGASGYLPEHTLEAKAMAHAQGADFLEQDLVLTRDDVPIVLHDIYLDTVTDVAQRFPTRARGDGRFYAIDFNLAEIRSLTASERFDPTTGQAVFPGRFPPHQGRFHIPTFAEELEFIQGLNTSTGRVAGTYPEIKQPALHRAAGQDITRIVLELLTSRGCFRHNHPCILQCFDARELKRVREEFRSDLRLVQLLEQEMWLDAAADASELSEQLARIAEYANGIGPPLSAVFPTKGGAGPETGKGAERRSKGWRSRLIDLAHDAGLAVHPWTYRADAAPAGFESFEELHRASLEAGVDGAFTDFPDLSRKLFADAKPTAR